MTATQITFDRGNKFAGKLTITSHGEVLCVASGVKAEIEYRQFTADYSQSADKKFFVVATRRRYGTLENAAAAVVAARASN